MIHVIANLDVEARLAGVTLPRSALQAIADAGTLLRALLPAQAPQNGATQNGATQADAILWLPAEVEASRLVDVPGLARPMLAVGMPDRIEKNDTVLTWALEPPTNPDPRILHHRRLAHDLGRRLGTAHPGARFIDSIDALRSHLQATGVEFWVVKAPYSAAGRDRHIGRGIEQSTDVLPQDERRVRRLLRQHGELLFEPWVERALDVEQGEPESLDFGMLGHVAADGSVELVGAHRLQVDARGRFQAIDLAPIAWRDGEYELVQRVALEAGAALAGEGYRGPFGVDGYRYRTAAGVALQPMCEINARLSFGFIARALAEKVAIDVEAPTAVRLCFGASLPDGPHPDAPHRRITPLLLPGDQLSSSTGRAIWLHHAAIPATNAT